jgi:RecJ-like exonuclease
VHLHCFLICRSAISGTSPVIIRHHACTFGTPGGPASVMLTTVRPSG